MTGAGKRVLAILVVTALAIGLASVTAFETLQRNPTIDVQVVPKGVILQNITVSCYQCIPYNKDKWEGTLMFAGVPAKINYYGSGSSVGITLGLGVLIPNGTGPSCIGYVDNSTCVTQIRNSSFLFSVSLDIHKTSSGGYLEATVYYANGHSLVFQATSGGVHSTVNFLSM